VGKSHKIYNLVRRTVVENNKKPRLALAGLAVKLKVLGPNLDRLKTVMLESARAESTRLGLQNYKGKAEVGKASSGRCIVFKKTPLTMERGGKGYRRIHQKLSKVFRHGVWILGFHWVVFVHLLTRHNAHIYIHEIWLK
jgi:hypothetical protein